MELLKSRMNQHSNSVVVSPEAGDFKEVSMPWTPVPATPYENWHLRVPVRSLANAAALVDGDALVALAPCLLRKASRRYSWRAAVF
ncbi:hypothetical protein PF005_g8483 [Phytophthora fragariae]|uniref:Uncharacterized protein n=1 Tax=Phytophthora fragariae TaxID=53985 RepID=A0A6A3SLN9_9STRA|nr:hypothetical protein PF003_g18333 [Phytophthora fragariae]KAE8940900.1 hypothetical protein PF009_g9295 [Phytophthora fragariae]KAE9017177.1 hypothetical protein PF011_g6810 [Phytophthora fragariae]KAE9109937.1 hypothetical protein PF010_g11349 [Phytophthora fragariae]KAE9119577.1 hypothetical protein PF007_g8486 [Phytophthora fragariae]